MKKLLAVILLAASSVVQAGPNDVNVQQRLPDDSAFVTRVVHPPGGGVSGIMHIDGATLLPSYITLGAGLSLSSGVLSASGGGSVSWASITGTPTTLSGYGISDAYPLSGNPASYVTATSLTTTLGGYATASALTSGLAGKFNTPTGTVSQYLRGDGSLATLPTATPVNYGDPVARTLSASTVYQASDPSKAAVVTVSPQCTNTTTVVAASACTLQVRHGTTSGLTCSTGTVVSTWTSTYALGLLLTNASGSPIDIKLGTSRYFIMCPTAGTFTFTAVDQTVS